MNLPVSSRLTAPFPHMISREALAYRPVQISILKSWPRSSTARVIFTMSASFLMMASNAGWFARLDALLM